MFPLRSKRHSGLTGISVVFLILQTYSFKNTVSFSLFCFQTHVTHPSLSKYVYIKYKIVYQLQPSKPTQTHEAPSNNRERWVSCCDWTGNPQPQTMNLLWLNLICLSSRLHPVEPRTGKIYWFLVCFLSLIRSITFTDFLEHCQDIFWT